MNAQQKPSVRGAFTLMEMMVAVAILAIMMVIFATVVSQTQETISAAHDLILAEREASAISSVIRQDLRAITRSGYLRVSGGTKLIATVIGPHETLLARDNGISTGSGADSLSDSSKTWSPDTWVGGLVRINDAVHTGSLGTVTLNTGSDGDVGVTWTQNQWAGSIVKVTEGIGKGTIRQVVSNDDARTFTVSPDWLTEGQAGGAYQELNTADLILYLKFNDAGQVGRDYSGNNFHGTVTGAYEFVEGFFPDAGDQGLHATSGFSIDFTATITPGSAWDSILANDDITIYVQAEALEDNQTNSVFTVGHSAAGGFQRGSTSTSIWHWHYSSQHTTGLKPLGNGDYGPWSSWAEKGGFVNALGTSAEHKNRYHQFVWIQRRWDDSEGVPNPHIGNYKLTEQWRDGGRYGGNYHAPGCSNQPLRAEVPDVLSAVLGHFHGKIDEVAVWGRALTGAEIQLLNDQTHVPKLSGTTDGPSSGDSYGLFFQPYPIVDNTTQAVTVSPSWMASLPNGLAYTVYFASNAALVDYGRISSPGANINTLWRRVRVLVPEATSSHLDVLALSLNEVNDTNTALCETPPAISLPPAKLSDWFDYLVGHCTDLQVAVYDLHDSDNDNGGNAHWDTAWTSQGKTAEQWPSAVRMTFTLRERRYELISNID